MQREARGLGEKQWGRGEVWTQRERRPRGWRVSDDTAMGGAPLSAKARRGGQAGPRGGPPARPPQSGEGPGAAAVCRAAVSGLGASSASGGGTESVGMRLRLGGGRWRQGGGGRCGGGGCVELELNGNWGEGWLRWAAAHRHGGARGARWLQISSS